MHVVWSGVISFGLVSIPVRLFGVSEERGVSLHHVHARDGGRIRHRRFCTLDGEEVPYADVARGFELPDGGTVVLTEADLAELPLSSSRAMDVLSFADADSIDPLRVSRSYYCQPTGNDAKAYVLLRSALERTGKVALGKIALRQREALALLRPRDGLIVLQLMLWPSEVRTPGFSVPGDDVLLRPREVEMATSYIEELTGEIREEDTVDRYRVALEQLVEAKSEGRHLEPVRAPELGPAEGLLEALQRSVEQAKRQVAGRGAKRGRSAGAARSGRGAAAAEKAEKPTPATRKAAATIPVGGAATEPAAPTSSNGRARTNGRARAGAAARTGTAAPATGSAGRTGSARSTGTARGDGARAGGAAPETGGSRANGAAPATEGSRANGTAHAAGSARANGAARATGKAPATRAVPAKRAAKKPATTSRSAR